ncbi:MAG: glycosyltransferase family 2 protein [bacterium]
MISLILPIYNEEGNIAELYLRSQKVLASSGKYEIIYVNDGSKDGSYEMLLKLAQKDKNIKILDFSRNFGHQIAITAGLDYAEGDAVVIMDSDLQDPPEIIPKMIKQWQAGYEIVYAKRRTRKDTFFKKATASFFYRILKNFANINIPEDTGDFRLMDRKVVLEMRKLKEHSRFMRGLTSWVGFKQTAVLFDRDQRKYGRTGYPFWKMVRFAIDGLTSFSFFPLKLASYIGSFSALIGFVWGLYAIYERLFFPERVVAGWTTIVIVTSFMGGIQLMILGVIGEYIGRIYAETQNRPLYIIKDRVNFD